ncbi:MAG: hypothetical protein AAGI28_08855 [Pseudomonadota bacterium]
MSNSVSFQPPRRLRVFSFDPTTGNRHTNRAIRDIVVSVPWELDPDVGLGPDGEYLQIVDYDPSSECFYAPLDLDAPEVRYTDGLVPSAENPKFHQQMIYAVCMETIAVFEEVLGRRVLWSPRHVEKTEKQTKKGQETTKERTFVRKLRIYPHALREANAYYDPEKKALLFGYFTADETSRSAAPDTTLFTCLSHDIIVHETVHAILDGMHPRFIENSNPDMLALHEAFADIVAIFQHFSHSEVLQDQIARTRGDLEKQSLLGALAQEFGQALGYSGALRDALGEYVDGEWRAREPDNQILRRLEGPHARGAVLVAAVFRAFLNIYKSRVADLFRIASGGSGILREGQIDPDLVKRLADEAAKSARHTLRICIRAMDYVPPVDVDFGDFLRALITSDHDLYPEDEFGYRMALIEAFSAWGIYAENTPIITEQALLWNDLSNAVAANPNPGSLEGFGTNFAQLVANADEIFPMLENSDLLGDNKRRSLARYLQELKEDIGLQLSASSDPDIAQEAVRRGKKPKSHKRFSMSEADLVNRNLLGNEFEYDRHVTHLARIFYAQMFWGIIHLQNDPAMHHMMGITLERSAPHSIERSAITDLPKVQVHSVRMASRIGKRGLKENEYVVEIIQSRMGFFDKELQAHVDANRKQQKDKRWAQLYGEREFGADFHYRCGSTLLIDTRSFTIRRIIPTRCRADQDEGLDRLRNYLSANGRHARNAFDDPSAGGAGTQAIADLHRSVARESF